MPRYMDQLANAIEEFLPGSFFRAGPLGRVPGRRHALDDFPRSVMGTSSLREYNLNPAPTISGELQIFRIVLRFQAPICGAVLRPPSLTQLSR